MKAKVTSISVLHQEKALQFYTNKLGFIKKHDIPLGEKQQLVNCSFKR